MRNLIIILFILIAPTFAFSATIFVPGDYLSIQDAIKASKNGDTVLVRPGVYVMICFLGKDIEVRSDMDGDPSTRDISPGNTILNGAQLGPVVRFQDNEGPSSVLEGFTLTNGLALNHGGGVYCKSASPTLKNNIITQNHGSTGGGIFMDDADPCIVNCLISKNTAQFGGGVFNGDGSPTMINCTLTGNSAVDYGSGIYNYSGNPILTNCILWNDVPDEICNFNNSTVVTYSCIQGGYPGKGNLSQDPLFVTGPKGDYYLSQMSAGQSINSPCVDGGDPSSVLLDAVTRTDQVIDQNVADMGYHFQKPAILWVPKTIPNVQNAIDLAYHGDRVLVAPGTHVTGSISFLGKRIEVRSDVDGDTDTRDISPENTILDGDQLGVVVRFQSNEQLSSVLEGFTITNGFTSSWGGGIYCSYASPTIRNNIITHNLSNEGAGIYCVSSSPTIVNCTIKYNVAQLSGGGLSMISCSNLTLANCTFSHNSAQYGGGAYEMIVDSTNITNCAFIGNTASTAGGGIYNDRGDPILTNCTFKENSSSYNFSDGIYNMDGRMLISNCIFWDKSSNEIFTNTAAFSITYSCIRGGYPGQGNMDQDPMFAWPMGEDCRLSSASPCIDAGDNTAPQLPARDFEGDPRVFPGNGTGMHSLGFPPKAAIVDMGADEYCTLKRQELISK